MYKNKTKCTPSNISLIKRESCNFCNEVTERSISQPYSSRITDMERERKHLLENIKKHKGTSGILKSY